MSRKRKATRTRGADWEPKVHKVEDRDLWMVDCGTKFTPRRIYCGTEQEAEAKAGMIRAQWLARLDAAKVERKQEAKAGDAVRLSELSTTQRGDLAAALAKAGNDAATVARAVEYYLKHHATAATSRLLCRVYHEYLRGKRKVGRRAATCKDAHVKLRPFVKEYRKAKIGDITTRDVERWLDGRRFSPITRNSYRAAIVALFNHAVRRQYISANPAEIIDVSSMDQTLPGIHSVAEVRRMLTAAANYIPTKVYNVKRRKGRSGPVVEGEAILETDPHRIHLARARIVPYLAIGYFAGLRPQNELANLDWKDISFADRTIRVDPATAKKRRQRYVDMPDNLVAWLAPYVRKSGKIGFSRFTFRAVRASADVEWPKDVMRHCFGSYHFAQYQDAAKTSAQMGHTRTSELFKSYRNLVKKSAAADYWATVPEAADVIQIPVERRTLKTAS